MTVGTDRSRTVAHAVLGWATVSARVVLAVVWTWAGLAKMADPDVAARAVRAYDLAPEGLVKPIAWGLPFVEVALAVLLLLGLATRATAWVSAGLFLAFVVMIGSAWARGLSIDCGCFGGGGASAAADAAQYTQEIGRDLLFLGLALLVALGPPSPLSLDRSVNR